MDLTISPPSRSHRFARWLRPTRRVGSTLGAFGATALIAVGSFVPALQQCASPSQQQQVVDIANQRRAERGLPALQVDAALNLAAQNHSADQARRSKMTHTGSDGSNPGTRIARTGYRAWTWGENVAAGQPNAGSVMGSWMNSSGHRDNILSANFREIGVGLAYSAGGTPYWTMVLASQ